MPVFLNIGDRYTDNNFIGNTCLGLSYVQIAGDSESSEVDIYSAVDRLMGLEIKGVLVTKSKNGCSYLSENRVFPVNALG